MRVFISSTFRDMSFDKVQGRHAERDHLVRFVFPDPSTPLRAGLQEWCRKKQVHLVDMDLRWGVTEEDMHDGKALDICLDEIDTRRQYFIGLVEHRYGFISPGHQYSITAQKIDHGVFTRSPAPTNCCAHSTDLLAGFGVWYKAVVVGSY